MVGWELTHFSHLCQRPSTMPSTYQQHGIQFLYPDNWTLVDEQPQGDPPSVTLQSPGTGYWNLTVYPSSYEPDQLTLETVEALREEYDSLEVTPLEYHYGDQLATGYHMEFYCLDLIVNARALAFKKGNQTLVFVQQAEDSEFRKLEVIYEALAISVLNHLDSQD